MPPPPPPPSYQPVPAAEPPATPKWWKKKRWKLPTWAWIGIVVLMIAAAAGGGDSKKDEPAAAPVATDAKPAELVADTVATTTNPTTPPTEAATTEPATTTTIEATTTTVPEPAPVFFGDGDDVVELPADNDRVVMSASHVGSANFIVEALDADLLPVDYPVNEIGAFTGSVLLATIGAPSDVRYLRVTADGVWSIKLLDLAELRQFDDGAAIDGQGPEVFTYVGGGGIFEVVNTGESNFIVNVIGSDGFPDYPINEIGAYTGRIPIKSGPSIIAVDSDGTWSITPS